MTNDDQTLGNEHEHTHEHDEGAHEPVPAPNYLTVEDVLASARLVERTASICLRADLTAEHDRITAELATLVTPNGELIGSDDEASAGDVSNAARAQELADRDREVLAEMGASMWHVRFRALPSDEWSVFRKKYMPTAKGADQTEFRTKIIAECAIEPSITEDQVRQLRKKFSASQIVTLSQTAFEACTEGGLDVPKSPNSWAGLKQQ